MRRDMINPTSQTRQQQNTLPLKPETYTCGAGSAVSSMAQNAVRLYEALHRPTARVGPRIIHLLPLTTLCDMEEESECAPTSKSTRISKHYKKSCRHSLCCIANPLRFGSRMVENGPTSPG